MLSIFAVVSLLPISQASSDLRRFKVVIDPGHGGHDKGATSDGGTESDVVLRISQILANRLNEKGRFEAILTRTTDKAVDLRERSAMANKKRADLFVSIHANSHVSPSARGTEFYIPSQLSPNEESMFLAERENGLAMEVAGGSENQGDLDAIVEDLQRTANARVSLDFAQALERSWRRKFPARKTKVQQGPFSVLLGTVAPSVLIEVAYLSNPSEAQELSQSSTHNSMADAIGDGIEGFVENLDKKGRSRHSLENAKFEPLANEPH